ncbi:MAG: class I SAM-dependent methyltransferase [Thermomicrobiales bacterium]
MSETTRARRLARLRARLAERLALRDVPVLLPRTGHTYQVLIPADQDRLLDEAETDPEQHLPYWAEVWPSGVALADLALERADALAGRPVLELGSGLGITATAALVAGAELLAADYSPVSLALCRYNALRNAGREPHTLAINWREPPAELLDRADALRGYPIILAADVLYEARDIAPLLALTARLLAPAGALWLAEPGRESSRRFLAIADEQGWQRESLDHHGPWPDGGAVRVGLHFLRRPAADR